MKLFCLVAALVMLAGAADAAEPGVTETRILLGVSSPTTGPLKVYGEELHAGSRARFESLNRTGGVNGRKIEMLTLDDAYSPESMFKNTKKLVEEKKVFGLFEYFGTPTVAAVLPYVRNMKVPMFFPYTGGDFIRKPVLPNTFLLRSSYSEETYELVKFATEELKIKEFGVFYQDDAYGASGRTGIERALTERDLRPMVNGAYLRNTANVDTALEEILKERPKAVFLISVQKPAVEFIKKAAARGYRPVYLSPTPLGTSELIEALGKDSENIYISEVVPSPMDTNFAIVREYQRDMKAIGIDKFGHISLENYLNACVFAEALRRSGAQPTREKIMAALESMTDYDLGGLKISFSATSHQGLRDIFLTQVQGGQFKSIKRLR